MIKTRPEATQAGKANAEADAESESESELDAEANMNMPLAEEDGWQIARASFGRELIHYSLRGGIALALLGGLVFGVFWAYNQMVTMPPEAVNSAQKMMAPIFKALPFPGIAGSTTNTTGSTGSNPNHGARSNSVSLTGTGNASLAGTGNSSSANKNKNVTRHAKRHLNRQLASRGHGHVRPVQAGDNPTGGRVIYSDGMITEYSWK